MRLGSLGAAVAGNRGIAAAIVAQIIQRDDRGHKRLGRGFPTFGIGICKHKLFIRHNLQPDAVVLHHCAVDIKAGVKGAADTQVDMAGHNPVRFGHKKLRDMLALGPAGKKHRRRQGNLARQA